MSPVLPKRPRLLDEPISNGWFDLPFEMREMIIDRMDPATRCIFAQCSKVCEEEAKASKNYIYNIGIYSRNPGEEFNYPELCISFSKESKRDYWYEFVNARTNQTVVMYKCNTTPFTDEGTVKWTKIEEGKPEDVRVEYLDKYLETYKNSIRSFHFNDESASWYTLYLDIRLLKHLEELYVTGFEPGYNNGVESELIDMEQLSRIKYLDTETVVFTFDQFLEFNGEKASLACVCKTDNEDLLKYLKMRQNGEIHNNLQIAQLFYAVLEIDVQHLMSELNGYGYTTGEDDLESFTFRSAIREICFERKYKRNIKTFWKDI